MRRVKEFCEFLTVFRKGKIVGTGGPTELPEEELIRYDYWTLVAAKFLGEKKRSAH